MWRRLREKSLTLRRWELDWRHGCDSNCQVETNYNCTRLLLTSSACSYNQPIIGELTGVLKDPFKNVVTFTVQLINLKFPNLLNINFSTLFTLNLHLEDPAFNVTSTGQVTINYDYMSNIEDRNGL
jgi:hypothetical protein